jgi:DNA-binding NarL/FixJ family response regulator
LLKTESCDEILLALEAVRRRHRFRSCALTALCEENAHLFTKLGQLTPREIETIRGITRNLSSKEIARDLGVSESTIETHRVNCMRKLDLHSQIELFRYALRAGLVEL